MNFGKFNPFSKKEAAPTTPVVQSESIKESAQNIAGNAAKLSAAAMALAGMLDSTNVDAANLKKDDAPAKKIEMSTQVNQKAMENAVSWEDVQKMQHSLDSIEHVRDSLLDKQEDLKEDFAAKAFKFNSIVTSVLEKHDKDTQKKFEDLKNLPALIQKYYAFINENRNNPNVNVEKAKAALGAMQTQMKDMTALMAQFGNLKFSTVHNVNSDDIQLHMDFNRMRQEMIATQEELKGTKVATGHEEELIADLQQEITNAQPTANNGN